MTIQDFNKLTYKEQDVLVSEKGNPLPTFSDEKYIRDLWSLEDFFVELKSERDSDVAKFHALETEKDFEPYQEYFNKDKS